VAAAGNSGYQGKGSSPALANPAFDKRIIAVGASDSMGTPALADDTVPDFSAAARTGSARTPDFVAPGAHIQGLRVPNSYIDAHVADAAMRDARFMRGSGTSESTAIASGAVALILDRFPHATPDQVSVCQERRVRRPIAKARVRVGRARPSPSSRRRSRSTPRPFNQRWVAGRSKEPADRIT
jgi:serine protease AprX